MRQKRGLKSGKLWRNPKVRNVESYNAGVQSHEHTIVTHVDLFRGNCSLVAEKYGFRESSEPLALTSRPMDEQDKMIESHSSHIWVCLLFCEMLKISFTQL